MELVQLHKAQQHSGENSGGIQGTVATFHSTEMMFEPSKVILHALVSPQ
jgi:hypothetical protein